MLKDIIEILVKSINVLTKLKKTHKQKWCSRLMQAHFLLKKFIEEMSRLKLLLIYFTERPTSDIDKIVADLERLRLHPRSDFLRLPWVVIKSIYVEKEIKDPIPGKLQIPLTLKYNEREDGIIIRYDVDLSEIKGRSHANGIIVMDQTLQSILVKDKGSLDNADVLTASQYLLYLLNFRLARLLDRLKDVVEGWANQLHIWDDLLTMEQNKLLVLDSKLSESLYEALRMEGQFYSNLMVHAEAWADADTNTLTISDTFFVSDTNKIVISLDKENEVKNFLTEISQYRDELENHADKLAHFISEKFGIEEILKS